VATVGKTTTIITFEEQMRGWLGWIAKARSLPQQMERYHKLNRMLDNYREISVLEFEKWRLRNFNDSRRLAFVSAQWI
jgi:tRNA(fMet)-specific endonuclease VapC